MKKTKVFSGDLPIMPNNLLALVSDVVKGFWADIDGEHYWRDFRVAWETPGCSLVVLADEVCGVQGSTAVAIHRSITVVDVAIEPLDFLISHIKIFSLHDQITWPAP